MTNKKHPLEVNNFSGTLEELAHNIGNLRYDKARDLLELLADDLTKQAIADEEKGRIKLANELYETAEKVYQARDNMDKAWKICKPYMNC